MKQTRTDWIGVWGEFGAWISKLEKSKTCPTCESRSNEFPDWDKQMKKIEQLVNSSLRKEGDR